MCEICANYDKLETINWLFKSKFRRWKNDICVCVKNGNLEIIK